MNSEQSLRSLQQERTTPITERFKGLYRAVVVETNDPLNMGRVKFRMPEMHNYDLEAKDLPWAAPSASFGGNRAGGITSLTIGDHIWVSFEKQSPYAPIWVGVAPPTRRKLYPYPQVHQKTPTPVNEDGKPQKAPNDYDEDYLPKDGRPMSNGTQDRYGNLDLMSAVGFFPVEHSKKPAPAGHDAIDGQVFKQLENAPEANAPDRKYMVRATKYGNIFIQSDQGYVWKNEFKGDPVKDEKFETKRWLFLQKLLNEGQPSGHDARRMVSQTRYGSRIEIRDTGWAQAGPIPSTSRDGEFGPAATLSDEAENDMRWIKLRTKGGMLFQAYDKGFHPADDKFVRRKLSEDCGLKSEREDEDWGGDKDARWMRLCTRYGYKIVADDRGSSSTDASGRESPRGNGIMIKGRRTPASKAVEANGNPRGFYWEFNENDELNRTIWGSPLGSAIEINDRYQYVMLASSAGKGFATKFQGLKANEFNPKPLMMIDPERTTHHLKIDHDNEYISFKTRAGQGPRPDRPNIGNAASGLNQGFEARDGGEGNGPWVELVDSQHRGIWFSRRERIGIWRAMEERQMYQWFDDTTKKIAIYNNEESGKIEIYCASDITVISDRDTHLQAGRNITIKATNEIRMQAGDTKFTLGKDIKTNGKINAAEVNARICGVARGSGAGCPKPGGTTVQDRDRPTPPAIIEPTDRGATYNGPFLECPSSEIEHTIQ